MKNEKWKMSCPFQFFYKSQDRTKQCSFDVLGLQPDEFLLHPWDPDLLCSWFHAAGYRERLFELCGGFAHVCSFRRYVARPLEVTPQTHP